MADSTNLKYYVSVYYSKKIEPKDASQLMDLAEKHGYHCFGTPETGIPTLSKSADPGDMAFSFREIKPALSFVKEVLGLEYILNVRVGLFR